MGERKGTKGLELWCRKMTEGYPGVKVENMTTSWRDGLAFCALIHHFRPDLIDFEKLNKADIYHNNELAFTVAERHLGIPALLEPEDMVEYDVPDRLSILTYLSQFYQTFESQRGKSGARIAPKRPQSGEHGIVSPASTSPPTKVQITVGRSRREPCAKCGNPVFIAERLNVGKLLYHRTCFRCARCESQLTLANYYETENGEFCCEICPDEEKRISKKVSPESVLTRSLSDEEKTANLQTFQEKPDAYSAHFEAALEYTLDNDLKKNATLSGSDRARSSFFQTQINDTQSSSTSLSSSSEHLPEVPKTKPPPLTPAAAVTQNTNSGGSFPNERVSDNVKTSDSAKEQRQTDQHHHHHQDTFVTKDSSEESNSGRVSVRARMKLFENNEAHKSDVYKFSSSNISDKPAPAVGPTNKKATVVAIDDLEDFDNISKKDVDVDSLSDRVNNDSVITISDSSVTGKEGDTSFITISDSVTDDINKDNSVIEIMDTSNDTHSDNTDASAPQPAETEENARPSNKEVPNATSNNFQSTQNQLGGEETLSRDSSLPRNHLSSTDDSFQSPSILQNDYHTGVETLSTEDPSTAISSTDDSMQSVGNVTGRGYYTAFEEQLESTATVQRPPDLTLLPDKEETTVKSTSAEQESKTSAVMQEVASHETIDQEPITQENKVDAIPEDTQKQTDAYPVSKDAMNDQSSVAPADDGATNEDATSPIKPVEYPEELNPFGDDGEQEEVKPVPAARPKKKITVSEHLKQFEDTPESLKHNYNETINTNPFEDDESENEESFGNPVPAARPKKKIPALANFTPLKDVYMQRISINPFEDSDATESKSYNPFEDEEDDVEGESPVKPVPMPTPRASKSTRPEPKPRDSLSIASRGSHGGSNSSLSSGSAFGSSRKKKPAPRPPIPPFSPQEPNSTPDSSLNSPCSSMLSVAQQSPSLSGTIRSRKTKRAPLPPSKVSTPHVDRKDHLICTAGELESVSPIVAAIQDKSVKDKENRHKQNRTEGDEGQPSDKSSAGRWKRRKGQAPSRPIPQRRTVKSLPISEIKKELDTIEIQQQGLEKQGVKLEQIIRERCEGSDGTTPDAGSGVPVEVEDLILQLFDLVNEKNELFRRQAELMYLRRQQRLEEEYADVEYQIRCLMLQPEANKSDSDKVKEETLIKRLVDIVERRNEIIECLEMDRKRETEEDNSINSQLNLYSAKRDSDKETSKGSEEKKDKKKKHKKLNKIIHPFKHKKEKEQKVDDDKDVDETEVDDNSTDKGKKKKFGIF